MGLKRVDNDFQKVDQEGNGAHLPTTNRRPTSPIISLTLILNKNQSHSEYVKVQS